MAFLKNLERRQRCSKDKKKLIKKIQHEEVSMTNVLSFHTVLIGHSLMMMHSSRLIAMARIQFQDPLALLAS